ncbi:hypothetical protein FVB43_17235 [Erwinia rhapontici]|uniref:DUF6896 domain-containing protein n=1 Tax=Erwinia rhapontici TaxID=55212 RepID=UPI00143859F9|nr:hypothetical protein [Erwinia rhapontici]NKG31774.1 hypothetical protein [Erwinia rhapontici]
MLSEKQVFDFISLQGKLIKAFFFTYSNVKDFDLLLDFPKKGVVWLDDEGWCFVKHGKGIRFLIKNEKKEKVVDINNNIKNTNVIDVWRLSQYFSLCDDYEIKKLLEGMVISGILQKTSEKQYELI